MAPKWARSHDRHLRTDFTARAVARAPIASTNNRSIKARYLYPTFSIDAANDARIATILLPSDATHPKPVMTRLGSGQSGGETLDFGNGISDYAMISPGLAAVTLGTSTFRGKTCLYGKSSGVLFYFARKGRSFADASPAKNGFSCGFDASVYLCGNTGKIISGGGDVTFY